MGKDKPDKLQGGALITMPIPSIDQERLLTLLALRAHHRRILAEVQAEAAELLAALQSGVKVEPGIGQRKPSGQRNRDR